MVHGGVNLNPIHPCLPFHPLSLWCGG
jgi:hypothetical protein